jgi:hypothetical protein
MKSLRVAILVVCASSLAFAGDPEFHTIVKSIEHTYGVHHLRIPFLGVAMFFARPSGVHGLKLAVFEGFHSPDDIEAVRRVVERSLGPEWHPFVRVLSRGKQNGETTLIYTNPTGNRMRMMIVNLEPSEAVVVKMDLSDDAIEKWLKEPGEEAEGHRHHQKVRDEDKERDRDKEHDQQMLAKE